MEEGSRFAECGMVLRSRFGVGSGELARDLQEFSHRAVRPPEGFLHRRVRFEGREGIVANRPRGASYLGNANDCPDERPRRSGYERLESDSGLRRRYRQRAVDARSEFRGGLYDTRHGPWLNFCDGGLSAGAADLCDQGWIDWRPDSQGREGIERHDCLEQTARRRVSAVADRVRRSALHGQQ